MRSIHLISKEALDICYAAVAPEVLERTAKTLLAAERIFIYAIGDTWITACAFSNMLMKLGIFCETNFPNHPEGLLFRSASAIVNATVQSVIFVEGCGDETRYCGNAI